MILLIDNYDSFVQNLARYVRELGFAAEVRRNDAVTLGDVEDLAPSHVILSPGPCTPAEAGISVDLIHYWSGRVPILGVCLGHQCIGAANGAPIVRAGRPMHGRTSAIRHAGRSLFAGLPSPFRAARYHSLVISRTAVPATLEILAVSDDDEEIMAVRHRDHETVGLQFHPESAATEYGYHMIDRFLRGAASDPSRLNRWADLSDRPLDASGVQANPWSRESVAEATVPPPGLVW